MTNSYQQLISGVVNRRVVQLTNNGSNVLNVVGLSTDKVGDLKGNKVPYVVMQDDQATVVLLHPRDAAKLFVNGDAKDFQFSDFAEQHEETTGTSVVEAQNADEKSTGKVKKEKKEKTEKVKVVTTKERAQLIYREVYAVGGKRSDFVKRAMEELKMTVDGAKTYHSNFHRVNHAWYIDLTK